MKFLILIIAFSAGFVALVVPILGSINEVYPDISDSLAIMVNTIPYLTSVPTSFLWPVFSRKWGNKKVIIAALALIAFGAVPAFASNFYLLLATRAVFGLGWGLLLTIPMSLVGEYLPAEAQAGFYGFASAVISLAGSAFTLLGGALSGNLRNIWLAHLLVLLFIAIIVFLFPTDEKKAPEVAVDSGSVKRSKGKLPVTFFVMLAVNLIISGVAVCGINIMSFFVVEKGVGGAGLAATLVSANTFAAFFGGLATGSCVKVFKKYAMTATCLITGLGYAIFTMGSSVALLYVGCVVFGLASGVVNAMMYAHNSWVVPAESNDVAAGITTGSLTAAAFFLTYVPMWICRMLGIGDSYSTQFVVIGAAYVVAGIIFVVLFNLPGIKEKVNAAFVGEAEVQTE